MTKAPRLTGDDFLAAAQDLLPQGRAWPRDPDATLTRYWQAAADGFGALHTRSLDLLETEADPAVTSAALADWERAFGLPDECAVPPFTVSSRRSALLARMAALGGQSRAYYIAWAAALGFEITIDEFRPFRAGESAAGDAANGQEWLFAWRINAPETTVSYFVAGSGSAGEPLAIWGNETLQCEMQRLAPAHTKLLIGFLEGTGGEPAGLLTITDPSGYPITTLEGDYIDAPVVVEVTPPVVIEPDPVPDPPETIPAEALVTPGGEAILMPSGEFILRRVGADPVVMDPVDPGQPGVTYPTGAHLRLEAPHGNVVIESQDGVNAVIRLVRPIYWLDRLLTVSHYNTPLSNQNTFWTYKGPGDLLGIVGGEPGLTRDITSLDDGTFTTEILEGMSDGSFLQLNLTIKIAPNRTGAIPAPSPIPPKNSVIFREEFAPGTGTGALNRVYGNVTNMENGSVRLLGRASAMTQTDPANRISNDYGFGNGRYEYDVEFIGDLGNAAGPALVLWPASDGWPGPEVDLGEFFADGTMYMALHWKDGTKPAANNGQDQHSIWPLPAGFNPYVRNILAADLLTDKVIFYVNGVEFARDDINPTPKDFPSGGENHTLGLLSGSDQSSDGGPSGLICWSIQFTPEALLPPA